MKSKFQFYKNIILVVASALTLVAVTFAWFTSNFESEFTPINAVVSGDAVKVDFYEMDETQNDYVALTGDIELNEFVPGSYNQYKIVVTTKTADKLNLSFSIEGLPEDMPQELKDAVCIRYSLYSTRKSTSASGVVTYVNNEKIVESNSEVSLSDLTDGSVFSAINIGNYQQSAGDMFYLYYEIGLSQDSASTIGGLESELGSIKISAQRVE